MRWIRPIVLLLAAITLIAYAGVNVYDQVYRDHEAPEITCDKDKIKISVKAKESELLKGLAAMDNVDGDITNQIMIESLGPILSKGKRKISYVVCDSSNNVGQYTRTIKYTDYHSPKIYLDQPFEFVAGKEINLLENMRASDLLDGDITSKIQCINTELYLASPEPGDYQLTFQVSNSANDSLDVTIPIKVYLAEEQSSIPHIVLSDYIAYVEQGETFDPFRYVEEVTLGGATYPVSVASNHTWAEEGTPIKGVVSDRSYETKNTPPKVLFYNDICFSGEVDTNKVGNYMVKYSVTTEDGVTGELYLPVVVYK